MSIFFVVPFFCNKMEPKIELISVSYSQIKQFFVDEYGIDIDNVKEDEDSSTPEEVKECIEEYGYAIIKSVEIDYNHKMLEQFEVSIPEYVHESVTFIVVQSEKLNTKSVMKQIVKNYCC